MPFLANAALSNIFPPPWLASAALALRQFFRSLRATEGSVAIQAKRGLIPRTEAYIPVRRRDEGWA